MKVMKILGLAGVDYGVFEQPEQVGRYVMSFDPEAHDGRGDLVVTSLVEQALKFSSLEEAMELYQAVPKAHPVRATDGRPNRPLTAYTVEITNVP